MVGSSQVREESRQVPQSLHSQEAAVLNRRVLSFPNKYSSLKISQKQSYPRSQFLHLQNGTIATLYPTHPQNNTKDIPAPRYHTKGGNKWQMP